MAVVVARNIIAVVVVAPMAVQVVLAVINTNSVLLHLITGEIRGKALFIPMQPTKFFLAAEAALVMLIISKAFNPMVVKAAVLSSFRQRTSITIIIQSKPMEATVQHAFLPPIAAEKEWVVAVQAERLY